MIMPIDYSYGIGEDPQKHMSFKNLGLPHDEGFTEIDLQTRGRYNSTYSVYRPMETS